MAEGKGFEPLLRKKRKHAFQACAFVHSATLPWNVLLTFLR